MAGGIPTAGALPSEDEDEWDDDTVTSQKAAEVGIPGVPGKDLEEPIVGTPISLPIKPSQSLNTKHMRQLIKTLADATLALNKSLAQEKAKQPMETHFRHTAPVDEMEASDKAAQSINMREEQEEPWHWHPPMDISLKDLHKKLGHVSWDTLLRMERVLPWLKLTHKNDRRCDACDTAKMVRQAFTGKGQDRMWLGTDSTVLTRIGSLVYGDTSGPHIRGFLHGHHYAHASFFPPLESL